MNRVLTDKISIPKSFHKQILISKHNYIIAKLNNEISIAPIKISEYFTLHSIIDRQNILTRVPIENKSNIFIE